MFPITNVWDATIEKMNQITYHKYWAVLEAPTVCTNGGANSTQHHPQKSMGECRRF